MEEDGEIVSDAAGKHKNVPDRVEVAKPVEGEEEYAEGIREAACDDPTHAFPADCERKGPHRQDYEPSLKQINDGRGDGEPADGQALEDNARDGGRPHDREKNPADRPAQCDQSERSVGAGDEEVDRRVIENLKDMARSRADQGVIERGKDIDQNESSGEDGAAHDLPNASAGCNHNEVDRAADGQRRTDSVGDGVGEDVAERIGMIHTAHDRAAGVRWCSRVAR